CIGKKVKNNNFLCPPQNKKVKNNNFLCPPQNKKVKNNNFLCEQKNKKVKNNNFLCEQKNKKAEKKFVPAGFSSNKYQVIKEDCVKPRHGKENCHSKQPYFKPLHCKYRFVR